MQDCGRQQYSGRGVFCRRPARTGTPNYSNNPWQLHGLAVRFAAHGQYPKQATQRHTRPKTQSIRSAYHFRSFRVGCVRTSCRALHLRSTVCLYLRSPLFTNLFLTVPEEGRAKFSVEDWNDIPHVLKNAQLYKWALSNRCANSNEFYQRLRNEISRHSTDTQQALKRHSTVTNKSCMFLIVYSYQI